MLAFDPTSQGAATTGETCQYDWLPTMSCVLSASTKNAAMAASGAVNRLGSRAPAASPSAEKARQARGHDRGGPPQRAAPAGLVRGHPVQDGQADQVPHQGPAGRGGPRRQQAGPPRPGGDPHQFGGAAAGVPGPHPRGRADHRGDEVQDRAALQADGAHVPQGRQGHGFAVGGEPEQREDHRQHPHHGVMAQFQAEQPGRHQCGATGGRPRPGDGRGVVAVMTGLRPGRRCTRAPAASRRCPAFRGRALAAGDQVSRGAVKDDLCPGP